MVVLSAMRSAWHTQDDTWMVHVVGMWTLKPDSLCKSSLCYLLMVWSGKRCFPFCVEFSLSIISAELYGNVACESWSEWRFNIQSCVGFSIEGFSSSDGSKCLNFYFTNMQGSWGSERLRGYAIILVSFKLLTSPATFFSHHLVLLPAVYTHICENRYLEPSGPQLKMCQRWLTSQGLWGEEEKEGSSKHDVLVISNLETGKVESSRLKRKSVCNREGGRLVWERRQEGHVKHVLCVTYR